MQRCWYTRCPPAPSLSTFYEVVPKTFMIPYKTVYIRNCKSTSSRTPSSLKSNISNMNRNLSSMRESEKMAKMQKSSSPSMRPFPLWSRFWKSISESGKANNYSNSFRLSAKCSQSILNPWCNSLILCISILKSYLLKALTVAYSKKAISYPIFLFLKII